MEIYKYNKQTNLSKAQENKNKISRKYQNMIYISHEDPT